LSGTRWIWQEFLGQTIVVTLQEKYSHKHGKVVAWAIPSASLSVVQPIFYKPGGPAAHTFYMVSNYMLQYKLQQSEKEQQLLLLQGEIDKKGYNPWDEQLDKDENLGKRIISSFQRIAEGLASIRTTRVARLDAS
jgi:hypothetical protein